MKNALIFFSIVGLFFIGCADNKEINGKEYETYGLFNEGEVKDPDIKYRISAGNVIWSIILCETVIFPVYFVGFSLWEPVEPK